MKKCLLFSIFFLVFFFLVVADVSSIPSVNGV